MSLKKYQNSQGSWVSTFNQLNKKTLPNNDFVNDFQRASILPRRLVRIQELHQQRKEDFALSCERVVVLKSRKNNL
jgi:hypothetical protein